MKKISDIIIIGTALFAMFLGAGNLIFPPAIGFHSGTQWHLSLLGFLIIGVGMPVLGIISMSQCSGDLKNFTRALPPKIASLFMVIIMLIIGPLLVIPRTAATTFELAIQPFNIGISPFFFSLIFFIISVFFVLNPNNVIDKIGKYLTPFLISVLSFLIIKGIVFPIGEPIVTNIENPFVKGIKEGYQTMDALGSMVVAIIVISEIISRGYTNKKDLFKMTTMVGLISCIGLGLVYGGLIYIGASGSGVFPKGLPRTKLIFTAINNLMGNNGSIILGIAIALACLTTSIGIMATGANYFSKTFSKFISYRTAVLIIATISLFFSVSGVEYIIKVASPILEIIYPLTIVLIITNLFSAKIPNKLFVIGALIGTFIIVIIQGISVAIDTFQISFGDTYLSVLNKILDYINILPFANLGFPWLTPALLISCILGFGYMIRSKDNKLENK